MFFDSDEILSKWSTDGEREREREWGKMSEPSTSSLSVELLERFRFAFTELANVRFKLRISQNRK